MGIAQKIRDIKIYGLERNWVDVMATSLNTHTRIAPVTYTTGDCYRSITNPI